MGSSYCPATLDATYNSATERRYDPAQRHPWHSLQKHPFLALRRWGRFARRPPQRAKSEEKRRLPLIIFLATDKPSPVPKQFSIQTWPHPPLFPLCILLVGEALLNKIQRRCLTLINIVNALTPLLWSTFCKIERQTLKQFCAGDASLNFSCLLVPPPPPPLLTFLRCSSVPGSVPERRISANPWIKFCSVFVILPFYVLLGVILCVEYILCVELRLNSILSGIGSGGFVSSSCMFVDKKTLLQIGFNRGLNVIISPGTGPIQPLPC